MSEALGRALRRVGLILPVPVFVRPTRTAEQAAVVVQQAVRASGSVTAFATGALAILAIVYSLVLGRALVLPVVVAVLLSFLLRSPVRWLRQHGLREPMGAAIVMFGALGIAVGGLVLLTPPARAWVERAPQAMGAVERKMRVLSAPFRAMEVTAARLGQLGGASAVAGATAPMTVSPSSPAFLRRAFGGAASFMTTGLGVTFLTYFLLASGDLFMRKLLRAIPSGLEGGREPRHVSREVEAAVSLYLRTAVMINTVLGLATWGLLQLLGMPNAALFGALAGSLNFIPYLGAVATTAVLFVAGLAVFDAPGRSLLVPGTYLVLNLIESYGVTPLLMGRQFPLNQVALFVGVMFWSFVWGIPGAILAVPMMVTLKILCDVIPSLHLAADFLGVEVEDGTGS